MADAEQVAESAPEKRSQSGTLIFVAIVLAVLAVWWGSTLHHGAGSGPENSPVKSTLHLETFVVNLAGREQRAYLRLGVDLGLNRELKHGEQAPVAQVRDTILGILSSAKVDDLLTPEGKSQLKADLLQGLKERVPELGVEQVYFTELLIQR